MRRHVLKFIIVLFCYCGVSSPLFAQATEQKKQLIFSDDFDNGLDTTVWISEIQSMPNSTVTVKKGVLILDTRGGVTVWLNKILNGDIEITFTRKIVMDGGVNDRLSDLNQFWMARDPRNKNLFTRGGKFEEYDSLDLFYVGMGGNSNTTTRFRRYHGGNRKIIQEYNDAEHLLKAGHEYHIRIVMHNNVTQFFVDGVCYFSAANSDENQTGYFGFRSTASRHEIDDVKVYQLSR